MNDPYGEGRGGRRRAVAWADFYWAWQNNGDGHVGGHGWWMVADMTAQNSSTEAGDVDIGDESATSIGFLSCDDLLILADPLALSFDAPMCVPSRRVVGV